MPLAKSVTGYSPAGLDCRSGLISRTVPGPSDSHVDEEVGLSNTVSTKCQEQSQVGITNLRPGIGESDYL